MSYITPTEAQTLLDSMGQNQFIGDEAVLIQCLYRASKMLDNMYGAMYPGIVLTNEQDLLWPRTVCYDKNKQAIPSGTIPKQVKFAVAVLAQAMLHNKDLTSEASVIKSEKTKVGGIETATEYIPNAVNQKSAVIQDVETHLSSLVNSNTSTRIVRLYV